jgi:predicted Rossmann-fold nucleotide-binding protein
MVNFEHLAQEGTISGDDLALFRFSETSEDACAFLERKIVPGGPPCHANVI